MPDLPELIHVMEEVRIRLTDPAADFTWSSWAGSEHAIREIDSLLVELRAGRVPTPMLRVLFAPTGPIQEAAISSGWGDAFLALADRFDSAISTGSTRG